MSDKLYPTLITNQDSLRIIIDYCVSKKLAFGVHPQDHQWNTEIEIGNLNEAIALGMFLQKNQIFPVGFENEESTFAKETITEVKEEPVVEHVHAETAPVIEFMMNNAPSNPVMQDTISENSLLMDDDSFASAEDLFEQKEKAKKQESEMLFN